MFVCPKCKSVFNLPTCTACGHGVKKYGNIWQLSDMPDTVTDSDDNYIGYEHIGDNYSGSRKYIIEERDALFAKEVSLLTGDGIFLDLACGDGCFTVPCAANGTTIIAGDISNTMLTILQHKAVHNKVSLDNVTLCRMNAYEIPLVDESVDAVVANSMLHLVSNSEKVIAEIYRVLKKGGCFICKDDRPGRRTSNEFDNSRYNEIVNTFYTEYWGILKNDGVSPKKYSWKFDRALACDHLFASKSEKLIKRGNTYETPIKDGFMPRFLSRGFSDQVEVPSELHEKAIKKLLAEFELKYGNNFTDTTFKGTEEDLSITIYEK